MPYVSKNPDSYIGKPHVGTGECVPLVEAATGAPLARTWRRGAPVKGNLTIARGTAIATFDGAGRYANKPHGNHAAIYVGQNAAGIQVIDQWHGVEPHYRTIYFDHKGASNNGNGFSVVE